MPQPQENQPDVPQEASPEEEPFEIELVIPESPTALDSPAEEQQHPGDHDTEDKTNTEHPPLSDTESEKMYQDANEVESFGPKLRSSLAGFGLCWSTWASLPLPDTGSRKSHIQGGWSLRPSQIFPSDPESSVDTREELLGLLTAILLLMPPGRPSHHGSIAIRPDCRTRSTTSCSIGRRINSRPTG
jgi:hypothetical protein